MPRKPRRSGGKVARTLTPHVDPSAGWTRTAHWVAPSGRHVDPGTELSIRGERGRFRFVEHVRTDRDVEWISVVGGPKGVITFRAFAPDRIKTVHVKKTTITAREAKERQRRKRAERRAVA